MATVVAPRPRSRAWLPLAVATPLVAGVPFTAGVLLSFLGFAWDVQWHSDVGPDTFLTAPHLVLYSGIALTGLTCLAMVLVTTALHRRGLTDPSVATTPVLGGAFRGPAGFVVGGVGAAIFLVYGLADQWWHGVYGFDVTLVSPPHVGLVLAVGITMVGCVIAFAAEARRALALGRSPIAASIGVATAVALLVAFITPEAIALIPWELFGRFDGAGVAVALIYPAALLLVAGVVRRPGAVTVFALVFTLGRLATWVAVPWVTREYAASIDLFVRDGVSGEPVLPGLLPAYLLAAAVVVDLALLAGRRRGWSVPLTVALGAAAASLVLRALEPTLPTLVPEPTLSVERRDEILAMMAARETATLLIVPVIGAVSGLIGWYLGIVLRRQGEPPATAQRRTAVDRSAEGRGWAV